MSSNKWAVDFETTPDEDDCRVWAWGAVNVNNPDEFVWGKDIDSFLNWCESRGNASIYFHNLKFDAQFIISKLLSSGYEWSDKRATKAKTFSSLITATRDYYNLKIVFKCSGHHTNYVNIYDTMKLLNMSVKEVARSFGMPFSKMEIDYTKNRSIGYEPTAQELFYLNADCKIIAIALKEMQERGIEGLTIGQCAMKDFKQRNKSFNSYFVKLPREVEMDIRQAYKGGFTYLNPSFIDKDTGSGFFLDKNSMFPSMLMKQKLPIGRPVFFDGEYKKSVVFPLYIQKISVCIDLKEGKIPFLRTKNSPDFDALDYITTTNGDLVTFTLTKPEIELMFENYDVSEIVYHSGWKFCECDHVFDSYINHWADTKAKAKECGNKADYQIAKMYLNALIGKFGGRSVGRQSKPVMNDEGIVEYKAIGKEERSSIYSPIALFTTAYARCDLVRTIQKVRDFGYKKYDRDVYVYSDTDSICVNLPIDDLEEIDKLIKLDDSLMGAWKLEKVFSNAKFLHSKCYMTIDEMGLSHATIAGMPRELSQRLKFEDFKIGYSTRDIKADEDLDKLMRLDAVPCRGGVVLKPAHFTIK